MAWFEAGDHARVLDTMTDFYRYRPEARFGHYLMMIGALGEGDCTATGRRYGEYENSIGTGQVHYWFDEPDGGFPSPTRRRATGLHPPDRRARRRRARGRLTGKSMSLRESRRILLDGNAVDVVRHGDELVAGDGRTVGGRRRASTCRRSTPSKIICVHLNYASRVAEMMTQLPPAPTYFHKPVSALNAHDVGRGPARPAASG